MNVYVCGAVEDILREFSAKIEASGHKVVGYHEAPRRGRFPTAGVDVVIIGTDQNGHSNWGSVEKTCKSKGIPCVTGPLRKWSHIQPRLVEVGLFQHNAPAQETEMPQLQPTLVPHLRMIERPDHAAEQEINEAIAFLVDALKGRVRCGTLQFDGDRMTGKLDYIATMHVDIARPG